MYGDFGYDPEVPAGFQDADILQAQYEEEGRAIARFRRQGGCVHGWWQTNEDGSVTCLEDGCGQEFVDAECHESCRQAALRSAGVL